MALILIADDDPSIRQLVVGKLRHGGHDVVAVHDGAAAVETCTAEKPDLVILDVVMPGMSGLDAARVLRQDPSMDGTPIIMLSARDEKSDIAMGFAAGVDGYIVKPFSPRELALRVTAALAGPR
jgi:two-component system response regulator MtrA